MISLYVSILRAKLQKKSHMCKKNAQNFSFVRNFEHIYRKLRLQKYLSCMPGAVVERFEEIDADR